MTGLDDLLVYFVRLYTTKDLTLPSNVAPESWVGRIAAEAPCD